jgi:phosphoribosyl-dephospho-CoA transferase
MSSKLEPIRRHSFAWTTDPGNCLEGETPQDDVAGLRNWLSGGRPVIIRRPCVSEDGETLHVGLALPPDPVKRRLAFRLPVSSIDKLVEPPLWTDCAAAAAPELAGMVRSILSATLASGLPLQTFGSHAWQLHTGLPYVTARSDIDLLVPIKRRESWRRFRDTMAESEASNHQIDLEVVLNGDAAFNWREFEAPGTRLLFKGNNSVWMGNKKDVEAFFHE